MKRIVLLPITCALVVACQDQRTPTAVKPPSFQLVEAGHDHFFFLPPIVPQRTFSGTFNPALKPVVVICQLDVGPAPLNTPIGCAAAPPVVVLAVEADVAGQQYKVNWDTKQSGINPDLFYRIQVFGGAGQRDPLGFADVDPVNNGSGLKNVNTNEYIGLVDGRTLPIKFRIERGAFGTNCTSDCAETSVPGTGGVVVTNTGFAGALFPSGWLPAGFTDVVVTIERVNLASLDASCIPLSQPQAEGCYRFRTFPDVGNFAGETPVTVGICVEIEHIAQHDAAQLFKVEEFFGEGITLGAVTALENAPATFVSCSGFASAASRPGPFADVARALRRLGTWFAPSSAYAAHVGVGGLTGSFSRIGWMLPTTINFDSTPGSQPEAIPSGTQVNNTYEGLVTFTRVSGGEGCGSGTSVFATNGDGSLATNAVSVCSGSPAFRAANDGIIQADFNARASKVCIDVKPGDPGSTGFLSVWDGEVTLQTVTSAPDVAQVLCVESAGPGAPGILHVRFAGSAATRAVFDNLSFTTAPASD
ncbi:MAG TPA: hypothetical protein VN945_01100 [Gemmatimonadales bacterium]|nr:hypothetical protein [Gemmatimonadales bacterium]